MVALAWIDDQRSGDAEGLQCVPELERLRRRNLDVEFADVRARVVRVELSAVTGTFYGAAAAGLAEIEVIARGETGP